MAATAQIFISYAREDAAVVTRLAQSLERAKVSCWFDTRDITPGRAFEPQLIASIRRCRLVLFLNSQHSAQSEWCLRELNLAAGHRRPILPVLVDDTKLPSAFAHLEAVALPGDGEFPALPSRRLRIQRFVALTLIAAAIPFGLWMSRRFGTPSSSDQIESLKHLEAISIVAHGIERKTRDLKSAREIYLTPVAQDEGAWEFQAGDLAIEKEEYDTAVRVARERFDQVPANGLSALVSPAGQRCFADLRTLMEKVPLLPEATVPRSQASWRRLQEDWSEAVERLHTKNEVFFRALRECERSVLVTLKSSVIEDCL